MFIEFLVFVNIVNVIVKCDLPMQKNFSLYNYSLDLVWLQSGVTYFPERAHVGLHAFKYHLWRSASD